MFNFPVAQLNLVETSEIIGLVKWDRQNTCHMGQARYGNRSHLIPEYEDMDKDILNTVIDYAEQ